jgi:phage terminase large subunit-like protein
MCAEPISLLYEKGRVLHRRALDQLEVEMMAFSRDWDRAVDGSPNRLDAGIGPDATVASDHADPDRISYWPDCASVDARRLPTR